MSEIIKEGWMKKEGGKRKTWKDRWYEFRTYNHNDLHKTNSQS
jgi:hypothetical protein